MDSNGFRAFLKARNLDDATIEQSLGIVRQFENFLQQPEQGGSGSLEAADRTDVLSFMSVLVGEERNSFKNIVALARYGVHIGNNDLQAAALELVDGEEVMRNLHEKLAEQLGEAVRDSVFEGLELPVLGASPTDRARLNRTVMDRLEDAVDAKTCRALLSGSLRDLPDAWYQGLKEKYDEAGNFDAFLERKRADFVAELEGLRDSGKLYFTQEITDEVIEFVKEHPEVSAGVREGKILYEAKIPYMADAYLREDDEQLKRYLYCHCPWARESLRMGESPVSPAFCQCSAGYHKRPYELIFGRELQADVVESVLAGDLWCKFAIHLPDDIDFG
ncbi:hypothetical protein JW848_08780 [Candidatus Bipolaricaulota bacterium]|nr:hypothetical protein [Candidatus Bipolaricaulota bacterium]